MIKYQINNKSVTMGGNTLADDKSVTTCGYGNGVDDVFVQPYMIYTETIMMDR